MAGLPFPYKKQDGIDWLTKTIQENKDQSSMIFAITEIDSDDLIGSVGLKFKQDKSSANLGYWLREEDWGKGYMKSAVKQAIEHAFSHTPIEKITVDAMTGNGASIKIIESFGFEFIKTEYEEMPAHNMRILCHFYELSKEKWLQNNS